MAKPLPDSLRLSSEKAGDFLYVNKGDAGISLGN
jgi:hypothetical protein